MPNVISRQYLHNKLHKPMIMALSMSSDGNYVVTTDTSHRLILWDLVKKMSKTIATDANIYSAYFIKRNYWFMWQSLDNVVHIQDVDGRNIYHLTLSFPVYQHVISQDLQHYFATDSAWNIYHYFHHGHMIIKQATPGHSFSTIGKPLLLFLAGNDKYLLSSGTGSAKIENRFRLSTSQGKQSQLFNGLNLWEVSSGKLLKHYVGNKAKVFAQFCPDNLCLLSGDENGIVIKWNLNSQEAIQQFNEIEDNTCENIKLVNHLKTNLGIPIKNYPYPYIEHSKIKPSAIYALKFIDALGYFIRINTYSGILGLYSIQHAKPLACFIINNDLPALFENYSRAQAIDSSIMKNILVLAAKDNEVILVFYFDHKSMQLTFLFKLIANIADQE